MPAGLPVETRIEIYDRHMRGQTLHSIAQEVGIHYETARKWWRVGRDQGREALVARPRKPIGTLRGVPAEVMQLLNKLRSRHRQWGIPYLRQQLLHHADLTPEQRAKVPSLSTLYRYVHAVEEQPFKHKTKQDVPVTPLVEQTTHPHHLWQVDLKEKYKVEGLPNPVTVLNTRDVYSSVTIGSEIFELTRSSSKVSLADAQAACRRTFAP